MYRKKREGLGGSFGSTYLFIPCSDDHKLEDWKQIIQRDKLLFPLPEITHFLKIHATNSQNYDLFYSELSQIKRARVTINPRR